MIKLQFQTVNEKGDLYHAPHQNSGHRPLRGYCQPDAAGCRILRRFAIDVHVGNLTVGAEIAAAQTALEEYDVILSRGGTAEAIRRCTDLKVVDIPLSVYDILRSIKLAENHNCKYAVIGFPAITRNATFLCEVLRYNVDIYTIHDQKEARTILQGLENSGCQMVLCDVVTNSLAQEYGIPACSSPPVSRAWRMH